MFSSIKSSDIPAMLADELPHLAAWLRDWEIPEHVVGDSRYVVKSYHHPLLLEESRASSANYSFFEYLDVFLRQYKADHPDKTEWRGPAIDLLLAFQNDAKLSSSVKMFISNSRHLGKMLASLSVIKGSGVRRMLKLDGITQWQIDLPTS
jgi:hypothetical protein